ncbi:hypothetical protein [Endozoicomonas numazuensis]|uniref:Uncharacterized protein n=1 Tax=Endozoicomonas numazuensis TaxID=1137799 RepID=A0A081NJ07_9GAMM|nr:hypothetical protein [Endozoicomonas numazuensis]KEQ18430.1 hypothetical protein GZ78_13100 [Endozoicomonas numazuensis]
MLKKTESLTLLLPMFILASEPVLAHPGHDHSHWSAAMIHALWIAPVILATGFAVYRFRKNKHSKGQE